MNKTMRIFLMIAVLAAGLTLQSCASYNATKQQVQSGKQNFEQQDFSKAFAELKPAAKTGNADAQYAIGYMYFYGKGVVESRDLAIYWMQKAASQHQPLAMKALSMIEENNALNAPTSG